MAKTIQVTISEWCDVTETHDLPARYEVCPNCEGSGKIENPAFDNGITSSDWYDWDDEDRRAYFSGRYDVTCTQCTGLRVVLEVDTDALTPKEKIIHNQYLLEQQEEAAFRMQCYYERMMGA